MAYHKILVPLDGSLLSEEALKQVINVAAPGAHVHLLSVMSIDRVTEVSVFASAAGQPFQPVDPTWPTHASIADQDEVKAREAYLNRLAMPLSEAGYQVTVQIKTLEFAADVITNMLRQGSYDVVVMATHGRTGLNKLVMGSVTQAVLAHSPCPMLIVPAGHSDVPTGQEHRTSHITN